MRTPITILAALTLLGVAPVPAQAADSLTEPPFSSRANTTYAYVDSASNGGSLDVSGVFRTRADGKSASARAHVQVIDPAGNEVWNFSQDYPSGSHSRTVSFEKLAMTSDAAGVWTINTYGSNANDQIKGNGGIVPFNVTPCADADRDPDSACEHPLHGRVWWEQLRLDQRKYTGVSGSDDPVDFTIWTLSPWGVQHKVTQYGYQGISSDIEVNNLGLVNGDCEPVYRSDVQLIGTAVQADSSMAACADKLYEYRIFPEPPDKSLPATAQVSGHETWVLPGYKELTSEVTFKQTQPKSASYSGEIEVKVGHQPGTLRLELDADNDGDYSGAADRVITTEHVTPGVYSYPWDGRDGNGNPIPRNVKVRLRASFTGVGEVHWVLQDTERRLGGLGVQRLTGEPYNADKTPADADVVSWDDSYVDTLDKGQCHEYTGTGVIADASALHACKGPKPELLLGDNVPSAEAKSAHGWGSDSARTSTWGDGRNIEDWQLTSQIVREATQLLGSDEKPSLTITKDDGQEEVHAGQQLTYTIKVSNTHEYLAESAVALTDLLPEHTTFISADEGAGYDARQRRVVWPVFSLAGAESATRHVTVAVDDDVPGEYNLTNFAVLTGKDSGLQSPSDPAKECQGVTCAYDTDFTAPAPVPVDVPDDPAPGAVSAGGDLASNSWAIGLGLLPLAAAILTLAFALRSRAVVGRHFLDEP
ncbi:MAG: DUF11 domain-containing protein [Propionibacteriaceae bacterium]|nr:DUF11 domain-containing protein [Propionibacteriaceae bacterium]